MQKILALLLLICLPTASAAAFAEETFDLSGCSDSELVALLAETQKEIVARKIEKTARLTAGTYIGGQDVPAGKYILAAAGAEGDYGIVSLASFDDPANDFPSKLYEFTKGDEAYSVFVVIGEGDVLTVPFPYTLTVSAGVTFQ